MIEKLLKLACTKIIKKVITLDNLVRRNHFENSQWFLDFQDKLNEISVK